MNEVIEKLNYLLQNEPYIGHAECEAIKKAIEVLEKLHDEEKKSSICIHCKYCEMSYDKHDWEVFYCKNEKARGCNSWDDEACDKFEKEY